jgi:DNA polymerase-3 subunit delta'
VALDTAQGPLRAVALLRRALAADRVAHAYAFVGPAGSGRMATAQAFAEALLCRERAGDAGACGGCQGCRLAAARQHPDLHLIVPTPPERNPKGPRAIRIGDVRELERRAALRPALAARKVFILEGAERMTEDAPQAFLKTLEEPPAHTVIILVLARPRAVPATVLSRCQLVRFAARADDAGTATARAEALALFAEVRSTGMGALFARPTAVDRDRAERLVDAYWLFCRDLLVARAGGPAALLVNGQAAADIARAAAEWSLEEVVEEIRTCREARLALDTNVSPRLTLEILLSRLASRAA